MHRDNQIQRRLDLENCLSRLPGKDLLLPAEIEEDALPPVAPVKTPDQASPAKKKKKKAELFEEHALKKKKKRRSPPLRQWKEKLRKTLQEDCPEEKKKKKDDDGCGWAPSELRFS